MRKKTKRKRKNLNLFILLIFVAVLMIFFSFSTLRRPTIQDISKPEEQETPIEEQINCEDLQIDVNSINEAMSYIRSTLIKPAVQDFKFIILDLTVTNKDNSSKDFSGHRLRLAADGSEYAPLYFSKIDKITLLNNETIDYACIENKLASISRLMLEAAESESGCKIFQVPETSTASSLSVYQLESLKCVIQL